MLRQFIVELALPCPHEPPYQAHETTERSRGSKQGDTCRIASLQNGCFAQAPDLDNIDKKNSTKLPTLAKSDIPHTNTTLEFLNQNGGYAKQVNPYSSLSR